MMFHFILCYMAPLHIAIDNKNFELINDLLLCPGIDVNIKMVYL